MIEQATTQIPAIGKPTVWQQLGLVRWKINGPVLFESLIRDIVETMFSELIDIHISQSSVSETERASLRQSALRDFANWNVQSLQSLLDGANDAYGALGQSVDAKLRPRKLFAFVSEARSVFIENRVFPSGLTFPRQIILLARALQETTLNAPLRLYNGQENVDKDAEAAFIRILQRIEDIRNTYGLADVAGIAQATNLLFHQIALADQYVWLPLRPLITAPLTDAEMSLYARKDQVPLELAYQIVKGDGVILVTGYRGVGKSTFINATLLKIAEAEKRQVEDEPWRIIPIQMNVAKVSNAEGILRLCIRAAYRTLRKLEEQGLNYLTADERKHLWFANLRASYKVNVSQAEALSKSRSLGASFGFKPLELLSAPLKLYVGGILPDLQYKSTKDWNEKMDRTISLLDYDEDRAEEDIVQFIGMLSTPRTVEKKKARIKLVFVFDELDKMEAKQGQDILIGQLKNLFLTRHAVFLLVTSKEFYYMLLEDRKKEDSILGSVFSSMITVPMFDSADTVVLLSRLITDSSELSESRTRLLENLARYLTYRARGLPREIIRELRSNQRWVEGTLQPYITDRSLPGAEMQIYARIQDVIENLNSLSEVSTEESPTIRERIWLNEGRKEQIRRGLYILMEDILNAGTFTVDGTTAVYDTVFSTIKRSDFLEIVDELGRRLEALMLPEYPGVPLFQRRRTAEQITIVVERIVYDLTGRRVRQIEQPAEESPVSVEPPAVLAQVGELLQQDSLLATGRALNLLSKIPGSLIPVDVQDRLYQIFLTSSDLSYRVEAVKRVSPDALYTNLRKNMPNSFLETETNEQVLSAFLKLVVDGATSQKHQKIAAAVIRILIVRFGTDKLLANNRTLLGALIAAAVTTTLKVPEEAKALLDNILKTLYRLDPYSSIPETFLPALQSLAVNAGSNLPLELVRSGSAASLPLRLLSPMFDQMPPEEVLKLWKAAFEQKNRSLNNDILAICLLRLVATLPDAIQTWLNSPSWDREDTRILVTASKAEPRLYFDLERIIDKKNPVAYQRVVEAIRPAVQTESAKRDPAEKSAASTSGAPGRYQSPLWLNLLLGAGVLAIYVAIPVDLPDDMTLLTLVYTRFLNLVGIAAGLIFLIAAVMWVVALADREGKNLEKSLRTVFFVAAVICLALAVWMFRLLSAGSALTLTGQLALLGVLICVYLVPITVQAIIRGILAMRTKAK